VALGCLTGVAAEHADIQPLSFRSVSEATSAVHTAVQPRAAFQQSVEFIIPELILGGEWTSVIKLTNRSSVVIPKTAVFFVDNSGNPMTTTFQISSGQTITDTGFTFFLNPGGMIEGTFLGSGNTQFGHAIIDLCSSGPCLTGLYAEVTLRNRNSTRPDFESVFPLEQPATLQYMLWDHRDGVSTVLYLCNESTTSSTVTLDFTNTANQLVRSVTVQMSALGSQILTLNSLAPETIGIQGTLAIRGNGAFITATALRINPSNSFTPMRAFVPKL